MLAQFQTRYPTGSLLTELLQIYQGKYLVRASVQIEGITRATGMAAAETIETAEDRARMRALAVLGLQPTAPQSVSISSDVASEVQLQPAIAAFSPSTLMPMQGRSVVAAPGLDDSTDSSEASLPEELTPIVAAIGLKGERDTYNHDAFPPSSWHPATPQEPDDAFNDVEMAFGNQNASSGEQPTLFDRVTPLVPHRSARQESFSQLEPDPVIVTATSEPAIDREHLKNRSDIEMKRLAWTKKQGRDYLLRTYGKQLRDQLTDEQMLEFVKYLESQPTPNDEPFA